MAQNPCLSSIDVGLETLTDQSPGVNARFYGAKLEILRPVTSQRAARPRLQSLRWSKVLTPSAKLTRILLSSTPTTTPDPNFLWLTCSPSSKRSRIE